MLALALLLINFLPLAHIIFFNFNCICLCCGADLKGLLVVLTSGPLCCEPPHHTAMSHICPAFIHAHGSYIIKYDMLYICKIQTSRYIRSCVTRIVLSFVTKAPVLFANLSNLTDSDWIALISSRVSYLSASYFEPGETTIKTFEVADTHVMTLSSC